MDAAAGDCLQGAGSPAPSTPWPAARRVQRWILRFLRRALGDVELSELFASAAAGMLVVVSGPADLGPLARPLAALARQGAVRLRVAPDGRRMVSLT